MELLWHEVMRSSKDFVVNVDPYVRSLESLKWALSYRSNNSN